MRRCFPSRFWPIVCVMLCLYLIPLLAMNVHGAAAPHHREAVHQDRRGERFRRASFWPRVAVAWTIGQLDPKFGVPGVLVTVPAVGLALGRLERRHHRQGPPATIYRHPGDDGRDFGASAVAGRSGCGRLSRSIRVRMQRKTLMCCERWCLTSCLFPGFSFCLPSSLFGFVLKVSTFGRYVYAIGGNEQAARLAGIRVDQHQNRGLCDLRDAGSFGRCSLHRAVPPGKAGRRNRSRAGCDRSGGDWRD